MLARLYDSLFQSIDKDLDGTLTFQEFIGASSKRSEMHRRQASVRPDWSDFLHLLKGIILLRHLSSFGMNLRFCWSLKWGLWRPCANGICWVAFAVCNSFIDLLHPNYWLRGGDNWHSSREGAESLDVPSSHCTTSYLSTSVDYTLP